MEHSTQPALPQRTAAVVALNATKMRVKLVATGCALVRRSKNSAFRIAIVIVPPQEKQVSVLTRRISEAMKEHAWLVARGCALASTDRSSALMIVRQTVPMQR